MRARPRAGPVSIHIDSGPDQSALSISLQSALESSVVGQPQLRPNLGSGVRLRVDVVESSW